MVLLVRCESCGKTDKFLTPTLGSDRNRVLWPWFRVLDHSFGDGFEYDFCSAACLVKWARVRAHDQAENAKRQQ